jgi:hypothetical protein
MEEVLNVYAAPGDARLPVGCFDEKFVLLHTDARPSQPVTPGRAERVDYEYVRQGSANLFFFVEPLAGWRHVLLSARRTKQDYAQALRWLADERYPQAARIRLVQDNLNTHLAASLYETFVPSEARRLTQRFEFHYTPKHASRLNRAEIEINIFTRQCLTHRVADEAEATLRQRIEALEAERNAARCTIQWRFTAPEARHKLVRLYPISKI